MDYFQGVRVVGFAVFTQDRGYIYIDFYILFGL